jgi:hypothetical protein
MKHFFAFRNMATALLIFIGMFSLSAQVFWTETFSNQASSTTNWINGGTNAGTETWKWTNNPAAGFQNAPTEPQIPAFASPTAATGYFIFNSDANGENKAHDVTLTGTQPINCTGKTNVHVRFHTQFGKADPGSLAQVGVSTDGTTFKYYDVFATLAANAILADSVDVDLNEADNKAQVWVRFRWVGNWEYHWKIDDVKLLTKVQVQTCQTNPNALICDDFETYNLGTLSPQSPNWTPWDAPDNNGILSADVGSVTGPNGQPIASNGTKAMRVKWQTNSTGTVQGDDQLLVLGNRTTGRYSLKWKMYIPSGKNAYYGLQHLTNPTGTQASDNWTLDAYFDAGKDSVSNPIPPVAGTYPVATWFTVEHIIDLDKNIAQYYVNGELRRAWNYVKNLGSVDFYAFNTQSEYYVDEVEFVRLPAVVENVDVCGSAVDITNLLGGAPGILKTSTVYSNLTATPSSSDPLVDCWDENTVNRSMWYSFVGDGNTYSIQTVQCTATAANYIGAAQNRKGDTQMVVYSGNDCANLVAVACNEDIDPNGVPDFRAGVEFTTEKAKRYYVLVDGRQFNNVLATGEFCIQVEQPSNIRCEDIKVDGNAAVEGLGFVCANDTIGNYLRTDLSKFVIPTQGPVAGFTWAITTDSVPAGVWPPNMPNAYWGSFGLSPTAFVPSLVNDSVPLPWNAVWYFTPVVVGKGNLEDPTVGAFLHNIDTTGICFKTGPSLELVLLGNLQPLGATITSTNVILPSTNNGTATAAGSGGIGALLTNPNLYIYRWSNGATSNRITNLTAGTYTVSISDPTGCTPPITRTVTITSIVGTDDPASVKALTVTPNPTPGTVLVNLTLDEAADVRFDIINTLGQVLQSVEAGKAQMLQQNIDLKMYQSGTYFIRATVNGDTAIRRVVLQK